MRLILLTIMVSLLVTSCSKSSTQPVTGTMKGTVVFHGNWPYGDMDKVNVSLFLEWPPQGPPDTYIYLSPPDSSNLQDTIFSRDFEITDLSFNTYHIAPGWHSYALGYGGVFTLSEDSSVIQDITIDAYFDTLYFRKISGNLTVEGAWPDTNTYLVYAATGATSWTGSGWTSFETMPPRLVYLSPSDTTYNLEGLLPLLHTAVAVFQYNLVSHTVQVVGVYGESVTDPDSVDISSGDKSNIDITISF